ncbi:hypothetical protein EGJ23_04370 [Pseudomonas sp. o96-267]|uniref:hypothetical protein n=1 Tax=Pseudomonas sp. o96-267 TaxID=2479853 RepID=UPI000F794CE8|nr:hypothetical protein [Pseudomonas sp. o96-267]RRV28621.1 hypothetical protein EGJ23_04370 [Pseudomonas sp. o96-267]
MRQDFHGDVGQVAAGDIENSGGNTHLELNIQGGNQGNINLGNQVFEVRQGKELPRIGSGRERLCPQCENHTWRFNQWCMHCDFDLERYDEVIAHQEEVARQQALQQRLMTIFAVAFSAALGLFYVKQFLPEWLQSWVFGIAICCGLIAFIAMKAGESAK